MPLCGGTGDRLTGLVNAFYLAMLTGRALAVKWLAPTDLENYVHPAVIDWRFNASMVTSSATVKLLNFIDRSLDESAYVGLESTDIFWVHSNLDGVANLIRHPLFINKVRETQHVVCMLSLGISKLTQTATCIRRPGKRI